uniref:Pheromone-binding protein-related protein 5 n=1 Tax=Zeugodacus cucurbitae TaxID=28588 RepID=A0A0A1WH84_ZEUCU
MKYFVVSLVICSLVMSYSEAQELPMRLKKIVEECKARLGAGDDDVAAMFKYEPATNKQVKCLHACTMRLLGILDKNNKPFEAGAMAYIKSVTASNAELEKLLTEVYNECKYFPASKEGCEFSEAFRVCIIERSRAKGIHMLLH